MAVNPDIHDRAYQFFIEEVPELLQAIEDGILQLRQDRSANIVHEVMRAAHSIKGGAASVELESIKEISHRLETAFRALYDESVEIDMELETLLLKGYDCLQQPLNEQMETGSHNPEDALAKAMPVLQAIEDKLGAEALSQADSFIPSSSDLGVDMVTSIFEIDVEQGIARLEEVAGNPSAFPVAGELQTQAEVFVGFGELLELPGFGALAQAILDALAQNPNRAIEILTVALADLKAARDAVMGGDRAQGGCPSEALLALAGTGAAASTASSTSTSPQTTAENWNETAESLSNPELVQDLSWENNEESTLDLDALAIQELLSETEGLGTTPAQDPDIVESGLDQTAALADAGLPATGEHANSAEGTDLETEDFTLEQTAFPTDDILSDPSAGASALFEAAATESLFATAEAASAETAPSQIAPKPTESFEASTTAAADPAPLNPFEEETQALDPEEIKAHLLQQQVQQEMTQDQATSEPAATETTAIASPSPVTDPWNLPEEATPIAETTAVNLETAAENLADLFGTETAETAETAEPVSDTSSYSEAEAAEDLSSLLGAFDLPTQPLDAPAELAAQSDETEQSQTPLEFSAAEAPLSAATEIIPDGTFIQENIPSPEPPQSLESAQPVETQTSATQTSATQTSATQAPATEPEIAPLQVSQPIEDLSAVQQPQAEEMTNTAVQMAMAELELEAEIAPETALGEMPGETPEAIAPSTPAITPDPAQPATLPVPEAPAPETPALDAAVQAVEELFEQLPVAAPDAAPLSPQSQPTSPQVSATSTTPSVQAASQQQASPSAQSDKGSQKAQKSKGQRSGAALSGISVRVDLSVLERMNNLVGELTLNRNSLSMQNEQLQNVVRQQTKRFKNFEGLLGSLRSVSDEMLVKPNSAAVPSPISDTPAEGDQDSLLAGFDTLEMDRYNQLHMKLQEVSEELMQLEEGVDDIEVLLEQATQSIGQQRQGLSRLQNELMWARMLPLDNILSRFPRVLRDLSAQHGKSVDLQLVGTSVLVDKGILEKLHDPMLHLLRNAFDHGIEPPEARRVQGKSERGTIEIRAFYQGNQTFIEIKDDGRGLKLDKIARRAVELGWLSREELRTISQQVVADMIFEPGFSTADKVSDLSGRGVGLDVVRDQLKTLKGSVTVSSTPGEGTKFTLKLPLTLSVAKLMVCQVGPLAIALPSDAIEDLLVPDPKRIKRVAQQPFLHWREDLIPIHPLSELLEYSCPLPDATSLKNLTDSLVPIPSEWEKPLLIFNQNDQFLAVQVDRLLMEQELVIKPFSSAANAPDYAYGCTILGDGRMIPVMDGAALAKRLTGEDTGSTGIQLEEEIAVSSTTVAAAAPTIPAAPSMSSVTPVRNAKTVLVVDDSTAMRRTLALSLQKAGYRVLQAGDGQEALEQLRQSSTIQLVICDVEMPTMNGFEFLSQRRREPQLLNIPVVMLTSRSSDKHRRLALQLNANSYFSKPYVEQEFLKAIHGILDSKTPAQV